MHLSAAAAAAAAAATAEATMATKIYGALFTERTESIATKRYVEVISVESFWFRDVPRLVCRVCRLGPSWELRARKLQSKFVCSNRHQTRKKFGKKRGNFPGTLPRTTTSKTKKRTRVPRKGKFLEVVLLFSNFFLSSDWGTFVAAFFGPGRLVSASLRKERPGNSRFVPRKCEKTLSKVIFTHVVIWSRGPQEGEYYLVAVQIICSS